MQNMASSLTICAMLAGSLMIFAAGYPARGDDGDDEGQRLEEVHEAVERGEIQPLSALKRIISRRFPGDIVRITTAGSKNAIRYEFRVLDPSGKLLEIEMDAASGKILEVEND